MPGTPIIYYGDEIGMGDNIYLGDRNGVRTPMQWSADRNAGFSRANPQQLYFPIIIDPEYHYESINVENQERNLSSLLNWTRRVTAMRRRYQAFGRGTMEFLPSENTKVLTFLRRHGDEIILVAVNLSRFAQAVELDLRTFAGSQPRELFSQNRFPKIRTDVPYALTVGPHGHYWLLLEPVKADVGADGLKRELPVLSGVNSYQDLISNPVRRQMQTTVLPELPPNVPMVSFQGANDSSRRGAKNIAGRGNRRCATPALGGRGIHGRVAGDVRRAVANPAGGSGRGAPFGCADEHYRQPAGRRRTVRRQCRRGFPAVLARAGHRS